MKERVGEAVLKETIFKLVEVVEVSTKDELVSTMGRYNVRWLD